MSIKFGHIWLTYVYYDLIEMPFENIISESDAVAVGDNCGLWDEGVTERQWVRSECPHLCVINCLLLYILCVLQ